MNRNQATRKAVAFIESEGELETKAFLDRRIGFMAIGEVVDRVLNALPNTSAAKLDDVLAADSAARRLASDFVTELTASAPIAH